MHADDRVYPKGCKPKEKNIYDRHMHELRTMLLFAKLCGQSSASRIGGVGALNMFDIASHHNHRHHVVPLNLENAGFSALVRCLERSRDVSLA